MPQVGPPPEGAPPEIPWDTPSTPPARIMTPVERWGNIALNMILKTINTTVGFCRPNLGFEVKDLSARSLYATGDIAILYAVVDSDIIKLIGHWRSNEMLRYLHVQSNPLMRNFLRFILTHGNYYFLLHQEEVPCF